MYNIFLIDTQNKNDVSPQKEGDIIYYLIYLIIQEYIYLMLKPHLTTYFFSEASHPHLLHSSF